MLNLTTLAQAYQDRRGIASANALVDGIKQHCRDREWQFNEALKPTTLNDLNVIAKTILKGSDDWEKLVHIPQRKYYEDDSDFDDEADESSQDGYGMNGDNCVGQDAEDGDHDMDAGRGEVVTEVGEEEGVEEVLRTVLDGSEAAAAPSHRPIESAPLSEPAPTGIHQQIDLTSRGLDVLVPDSQDGPYPFSNQAVTPSASCSSTKPADIDAELYQSDHITAVMDPTQARPANPGISGYIASGGHQSGLHQTANHSRRDVSEARSHTPTKAAQSAESSSRYRKKVKAEQVTFAPFFLSLSHLYRAMVDRPELLRDIEESCGPELEHAHKEYAKFHRVVDSLSQGHKSSAGPPGSISLATKRGIFDFSTTIRNIVGSPMPLEDHRSHREPYDHSLHSMQGGKRQRMSSTP